MSNNEFYEKECLAQVKYIAKEINYLAESSTDKDEAERRATELENIVEDYMERNNNCFEYPDDYEPLNEFEQDELEEAKEELEEIQKKLDNGEPFNLNEYFYDCLDIEYRIDSSGDYRSVAITVTTGGPHIEVDTGDNNVKLWWGGNQAQWGITSKAADIIDDIFSEYYDCTRA